MVAVAAAVVMMQRVQRGWRGVVEPVEEGMADRTVDTPGGEDEATWEGKLATPEGATKTPAADEVSSIAESIAACVAELGRTGP